MGFSFEKENVSEKISVILCCCSVTVPLSKKCRRNYYKLLIERIFPSSLCTEGFLKVINSE